MLDPFTISMGLTIAGGALNFMGVMNESEAASRAASYNRGLAQKNAQLTRKQTEMEEARLRQQGAREIGQAVANFGASGVSVTGSALDVLVESARTLEEDALFLRHTGQLQAAQFDAEAKYIGEQDRAQRQTAMLRGVAGLIGTGAQAYDTSSRLRRT